jgi:hypothetical protein
MIFSRDTPLPSARPERTPRLRRAQCALPALNKSEENLESRWLGLSTARLPIGRIAGFKIFSIFLPGRKRTLGRHGTFGMIRQAEVQNVKKIKIRKLSKLETTWITPPISK